jgi:hypothetical protein
MNKIETVDALIKRIKYADAIFKTNFITQDNESYLAKDKSSLGYSCDLILIALVFYRDSDNIESPFTSFVNFEKAFEERVLNFNNDWADYVTGNDHNHFRNRDDGKIHSFGASWYAERELGFDNFLFDPMGLPFFSIGLLTTKFVRVECNNKYIVFDESRIVNWIGSLINAGFNNNDIIDMLNEISAYLQFEKSNAQTNP